MPHEMSVRQATAWRIADLAVSDCLFAGVTQRKYDEVIGALDSTFEAVRTGHQGRRNQ